MGTVIQLIVNRDQRLPRRRRRRRSTPDRGFDVMALPDLAVTRRLSADGTRLLVGVVGEVDLATAPALSAALEQARRDLKALQDVSEIVVDLRRVGFLGAAGLDALVRASDGCRTQAVGLRVVADQRAVTRSLTLTGLDHELGLTSSLPAREHRSGGSVRPE